MKLYRRRAPFFAVPFLAVPFRAVVLLVERDVPFFALLLAERAGREAAFLAVPFFAGAFLAVPFLAVDFLATAFLAVVLEPDDFFAAYDQSRDLCMTLQRGVNFGVASRNRA